MKLSRTDITRFWSKVDRSGGTNACWLWKAGVDKDGYGKFAVGPNGAQKHFRAHRIALRLHTGRLGPVAMHWKCDNPPCCNGRHLKWGTQRDNRNDSIAKGNQPRGESSKVAILTAEAVRTIRRLGRSYRGAAQALAKRFGVRPVTVYAVLSGRNWKYTK